MQRQADQTRAPFMSSRELFTKDIRNNASFGRRAMLED
jgi:hypothetical protein